MRLRWLHLVALILVAIAAPARGGDLSYLVHAPAEASAHPPLIVLLHGAGADERDMVTLWRDLPQTFVVVSPRAPFASAGGGFRWYRNGSRAADLVLDRKILDLVVDNAVARFGADPHRLFIGGFSQGAVATYDIALHEPDRFRGAAVLSGSLSASSVAAGTSSGRSDATTFFIGHGTADTRIPFAAAAAARTDLAKRGLPVALHAYAGMRHETGAAEVADLAAWLKQLAASGSAAQ